jgi:hypothetical protein
MEKKRLGITTAEQGFLNTLHYCRHVEETRTHFVARSREGYKNGLEAQTMLKSHVTNCCGRVNISQLAGVHPASRPTGQRPLTSPSTSVCPSSLVSCHLKQQKCRFVNCNLANF